MLLSLTSSLILSSSPADRKVMPLFRRSEYVKERSPGLCVPLDLDLGRFFIVKPRFASPQ